ncbi:hypothetical protein BKA70DRAFT_1265671 [Coprinopsis sp. MPI-PUGE-AT-0042]|nr:hypothetical protein BKA70DRAFT_1265671 [Coprinopsis sp. MPI-PUGE-AT-0042]
MSIELPVEILHRIVDFNHRDRRFLLGCSLACKVLSDRCQKHLFASPMFTIDVDFSSPNPGCISRSHWMAIKPATIYGGGGNEVPLYGVFKMFQGVVAGSPRLASLVHNFSLGLRPVRMEFPTSGNLDWSKFTPSLLNELLPVLSHLPSLDSFSITNNLCFLLPGDVDLDILFTLPIPDTLRTLEIVGFTCRIPSAVTERLHTLMVEDSVVTLEGTAYCLQSLVYINVETASLDRLVGKESTSFPALDRFGFYSVRPVDHETAHAFLESLAIQISTFTICMSSHFGVRDPLPASRAPFLPMKPIKTMVFDVSSDAMASDLSKRIKDMMDVLVLWELDGRVDEVEFRLRYPHIPFLDADIGADLCGLSDWSRLKEVIAVSFPPGSLKSFKIHITHTPLSDPAQPPDSIFEARDRTVTYLTETFSPLEAQGIAFGMQFDIDV